MTARRPCPPTVPRKPLQMLDGRRSAQTQPPRAGPTEHARAAAGKPEAGGPSRLATSRSWRVTACFAAPAPCHAASSLGVGDTLSQGWRQEPMC